MPNIRYDQDFYAWTQEQAALLRASRLADIDLEHLAEEIESMGASERRELDSRIKILVQHLLKWRHQPQPRSSGWTGTIGEQRYQLAVLLRQSPSLRRRVGDALEFAYPYARRAAARETGLPADVFPPSCPFTADQVLGDEFWPD